MSVVGAVYARLAHMISKSGGLPLGNLIDENRLELTVGVCAVGIPCSLSETENFGYEHALEVGISAECLGEELRRHADYVFTSFAAEP